MAVNNYSALIVGRTTGRRCFGVIDSAAYISGSILSVLAWTSRCTYQYSHAFALSETFSLSVAENPTEVLDRPHEK